MTEKKEKEVGAETRAFQEHIREFIAEGTKAHVLLERTRCMRILVAVLNEEHEDLQSALDKAKRMIEGGHGSAFTTREAIPVDDYAIRIGAALVAILGAPAGVRIVPSGPDRFQVMMRMKTGEIGDEIGDDLVALLEKLAARVPKKPYTPVVRRPWEDQLKKEA